MDLGTSVALFLALAVVILVLFCLVTKYFQYKMNKKAQQQGQTFSQVDQVGIMSEQDLEGQYQQFLQKRKQNVKNQGAKNRDKAYMFQKTQVQDPLKENNDLIYGVSMLRRRLDGQVPSSKIQNSAMTGRSVPSIKSFRPERMHNSNTPTERGLMPPNSSKAPQEPVSPVSKHEFISKLISYNEQGLLIMNIEVQALIKRNGKISEIRMVNTTSMTPREANFEDQLQLLGFQPKNYSCMKFKVSTEIPYMVENKEYKLSALKISESKEEIEFSEYYLIKDQIENSLG